MRARSRGARRSCSAPRRSWSRRRCSGRAVSPRRRPSSTTRSSASRSSSRSTCSSATRASSRSATSASWRSAPARPASSRVPTSEKPAIMPNLAHFLRHWTTREPRRRSCSPRAVAGVCALVVGAAADAPLGPRGGHRDLRACSRSRTTCCATGADRPGAERVLLGARDDGAAAGGARRARRDRGRVPLRRSRFGRLLRATREDPAAARAVGVSIYGQRLIAFALSGVLAGLAGGLTSTSCP